MQGNLEETVEAYLRASRGLVAVAARSLASADDVTLPQFRALVVLSGEESVTVSHLAEILEVQPSTVTRLCDRLVAKGLVRRAPGVADRRAITVTLTGEGRALVDRVISARRQEIAEVAARMAPADRAAALVGLRAFADAMTEPFLVDVFGWEHPDGDRPSGPVTGACGAEGTGDDAGVGRR